MAGTSAPSRDRIGRAPRSRVVGFVLFALISTTVVLLLFAMPIPHEFRLTESYSTDLFRCSGATSVSIPSGDAVAFEWSAPSNVSFGVWNCSAGYVFLEQHGARGSGSFVSSGGAYGFTSLCGPLFSPSCPLANVTGTYSGTLLKF